MTTWSPTRGGAQAFRRAARAGRPYWTINESIGGCPVYTEWVFTGSRITGFICGHMTPGQVMAHYGPLTDEPPKSRGEWRV